jgi:hypothetical protein
MEDAHAVSFTAPSSKDFSIVDRPSPNLIMRKSKNKCDKEADPVLGPDSPKRSFKYLNDRCILQALKEDWNAEDCVTPGFQFKDQSITTYAGSSLRCVTRPAGSMYEKLAFLFLRDCRDLPVFTCALLASGEFLSSIFFLTSCSFQLRLFRAPL